MAVRVLLTGMSGTGKTTLVRQLRRRGHVAYDADEDGFSEPRSADLGLTTTAQPAVLADLVLSTLRNSGA